MHGIIYFIRQVHAVSIHRIAWIHIIPGIGTRGIMWYHERSPSKKHIDHVKSRTQHNKIGTHRNRKNFKKSFADIWN